MIKMLEQLIQNGVDVKIGKKNEYDQYPVYVTDKTNSVTSGWTVLYRPKLFVNGTTKLRDPKDAFSFLIIKNFKNLYQAVMQADQDFLAGKNVEEGYKGKRATYDKGVAIFTVYPSPNPENNKFTTIVKVTITDEKSPFYMLSIFFRVTNGNNGQRHLVGQESNWDFNEDTFNERNAWFVPRRFRFVQVHQEANGPAHLRVGLKGNVLTNPTNDPEIKYLHPIDDRYTAMAYVVEQIIIEYAMKKAIEQLDLEKELNSAIPASQFYQEQSKIAHNSSNPLYPPATAWPAV